VRPRRDRIVDHVLELGERDDRIEPRGDFAAAQSEQHARQRRVFAAGQLRKEANLEAEQRRSYARRTLDRAAIASENAGEHAQQRRLSRAVASDDAERLAVIDVERHSAQRPAVTRAAREDPAADQIAHGDVVDAQKWSGGDHAGRRGYSSSRRATKRSTAKMARSEPSAMSASEP